MGTDVNAVCQSADNQQVGEASGQFSKYLLHTVPSVGGGLSGTYNAQHQGRIQVSISLEVEEERCIITLFQAGRIVRILPIEDPDVILFRKEQLLFGPFQYVWLLDGFGQGRADVRDLFQQLFLLPENSLGTTTSLQQLAGNRIAYTMNHS